MTITKPQHAAQIGYLRHAGRESIAAAANTEKMITLCRLAGVDVTSDEAETLRSLFATIGQRIDDMAFNIRTA